MANDYIRKCLKTTGIKMWQLADELGMSEFTLSRKMRYEFSELDRTKYVQAINKLVEDRENGNWRFD